MALQQDVSYKGINIPNAYIKIAYTNSRNSNFAFNLAIYANEEIARNDVNNVDQIYISQMYYIIPDLTSPDNIIKQMYDYLKTLPEFSTAVDV